MTENTFGPPSLGSLPSVVWEWPGRATRCVVDLDAIRTNVSIVGACRPNAEVMAIVKANAYGHGAVPVARAAISAGAVMLGVATVSEGIELRQAGIEAPILVLGPIDPSEIAAVAPWRLQIAVGDEALLEVLSAFSGTMPNNQHIEIHLKIDTGMHRYGFDPAQIDECAKVLNRSRKIRTAGVFTHFARADEPDHPLTRRQLDRFEDALAVLRSRGLQPEHIHVSNSAGSLGDIRLGAESMVRLGIGLYGLPPSTSYPLAAGMRPAMTMISRVRRVSWLAARETVGYGGTFVGTKSHRLALVPIGYADGYSRHLSNKGWMMVAGHRAEVRGRVSMDQTVVEIPTDVAINDGAPVVVFGSNAVGIPRLTELATLAGTINYELATAVSRRVPRLYVQDGGSLVDIVDMVDTSGAR